jgi:ketosteroid isomerase-like protein
VVDRRGQALIAQRLVEEDLAVAEERAADPPGQGDADGQVDEVRDELEVHERLLERVQLVRSVEHNS